MAGFSKGKRARPADVSGADIASSQCLRESQLAERWQVSPRTLQRWRAQGTGPDWLQINGVILYRLTDIAAFEQYNKASAPK